MGEGAVRLHHGRQAEPVLSDQEEVKGRRQAGVTELLQTKAIESI